VSILTVVGIPASTTIGVMMLQIKKKKRIMCDTRLVWNTETLREDETLESLVQRGFLPDGGAGAGGKECKLILRRRQTK
jgi:hypothetical protein